MSQVGRPRRLRRGSAIVGLIVLLVTPGRAAAIKWEKGCPLPREKLFGVGSGPIRMSTTSPFFVHPGHELGLFLDERRLERGGGGFSIEPGGNVVEVVFQPHGGDPIPLPPFSVAAVSASALYIPFPDTRDVLGRVLAGPMKLTVRTGDQEWTIRKMVALPPANDVLTLVEQGEEGEVLGAVALNERLWVPLEFSGFGPGEPMPSCPVEITPKIAFAVGVSVSGRGAERIPHLSLANLRSGYLFFGDFMIGDRNVYGSKLGKSLRVKMLRGGGVAICGMNDALSLVLKLRLNNGALGPSSRIIPTIQDGSPLKIQLKNISADPIVASQLNRVTKDGFGTECLQP